MTPEKGGEYHATVDFKHPYLTRQIIAYIGNKRRLLPLIHRALHQIYGDTVPKGLKFADPFAGSGVVSRLAKFLGFQVVSNDWEPYAFTIGRAYLEIDASHIETLFGSCQEFEKLLSYLNTLPDPPVEEQYIARYYAPASDDPEQADYRKERLFYTRQNALRIDRIRNEIDRLYPPPTLYPACNLEVGNADRISRCRDLLIALLLYEAATHTNTSGVFKAYHRGFGGHGKDALGRILRPIHLEPPPLIDSPFLCRMYQEDATRLFRSLEESFDLVYLDPPYNQHQYGSNYHLLNTIVLWDKVPAPLDLGPDGRLRNKAGIRKDWKRTKSAYCYRDTAIEAFAELLDAIDAEHLLVSYSTDGIIPFETLRDLCAAQGEVSILTNEYITYRGGKQSNHRQDRNIEFILWVDRARKRKHGVRKEESVDRVLVLRRVQLLLRRVYRASTLRERFEMEEGENGVYRVWIPLKERRVAVRFRHLLEPDGVPGIEDFSREELLQLEEILESAVCRTRREELDAILHTVREVNGLGRARYLRKSLKVLRKLAHRKYRDLFRDAREQVRQVVEKLGEGSHRMELEEIHRIAQLRFGGRE